MPSLCRTLVLAAALSLATSTYLATLTNNSALAKPGTHAPAISTWDIRASSAVPSTTLGFFGGGHLHYTSYSADFSSTTGKLSAQFGLHYVNLRQQSDGPILHGMSAGAVALISQPFGERFDNGVPKTALAFYLGSIPTILSSGRINYVSLPLVLGLGFPLSPGKAITFVPWVEVAPSLNLDTVIRPFNLSAQDPTKYVDPATGQIKLNEDDVAKVLAGAIEIKTSASAALRWGLAANIHVGDTLDLDVAGIIASLGNGADQRTVVSASMGIAWHWDDIVPAVLPAERRLLRESCEAVEQRFRTCPRYREPAAPIVPAPAPSAAPTPTGPIPPASPVGPEPVAPWPPPPASPNAL